MITWTQISFQEAHPSQELKENTELSGVVLLLSEVGGKCLQTWVEFTCSGTFDSIFVPWSHSRCESGMLTSVTWAEFGSLITCGELPSGF